MQISDTCSLFSYLDSRIDFLLVGAALADQTSCRFALTLVAKTLAVLLRLDEYFQMWLYTKHQTFVLRYYIVVCDDYVTKGN